MEVDTDAVQTGLLTHLLTLLVFGLALLMVARLLSEKRQPSNTFAWLIAIAFIPYIGIPLYLLFGGRKIRRLARLKTLYRPQRPDRAAVHPLDHDPTSKTLTLNGSPPAVGGNVISLLPSGEEAFAELRNQIFEARESIHLMVFILGRDAVGRTVVNLLARRAREGVRVRLLLDAFGSFLVRRRHLRPLTDAGGEVSRFLPVVPLQTRSSANLRNHRKIAVFDGRRALIGGHNIAREYMGPVYYQKRWRDFGALVEGPAAVQLNEVFLNDWAFASGQGLDEVQAVQPEAFTHRPGKSAVQVVASGPDVALEPLYEGIISMIQEAERRIWVVTPYFIPDEVLLRSLVVKARAGHEVKIIVPEKSNHPITDVARRHFLRELQGAGADVLLYQPGMLHAKVILVDDKVAMFGSANLDLRSLFVNFEIGLFLYSPGEIQQIAAWIEETIGNCYSAKTENLKPPRLMGRLAEDLSTLLAPLL